MPEQADYVMTPIEIPDPVITFADGSTLTGDAGYSESSDDLWIWPSEKMDIMEIVTIFDNPEKTAHIHVDHSKVGHEEFEGYTQISNIRINSGNGLASINMRKP